MCKWVGVGLFLLQLLTLLISCALQSAYVAAEEAAEDADEEAAWRRRPLLAQHARCVEVYATYATHILWPLLTATIHLLTLRLAMVVLTVLDKLSLLIATRHKISGLFNMLKCQRLQVQYLAASVTG